MKIIPTVSIHTKSGLFLPGSEINLPDGEARSLIERDYAIPAPSPVKPAKPAEKPENGKAGEGGE
jgi:hypothetical protein